MKIAIVALILCIVAVVALALSDALINTPTLSTATGGEITLLIVIPISLGLLAYLAHRQSEQHKEQEKR